MKSLFKTVSIIIIFTGITRLVGFLFRVWLSRAIGTEMLGLYQISFSVFMVLLTIVSSGLPLIISRMTAKKIAQKDKDGQHSVLTSALILSLIISLVIALVVIILQKPLKFIFTDERCMNILLCLLPALVFSSMYGAFRGNLWGRNKYIASCSAELVEQIVRIMFCIFFLGGIWSIADGSIVAALSLSVACVVSCIYVMILYFSLGGRFKKPKYFKEILKTSTPITAIRIISSLIQPIIAIIIPLRLVASGYTDSQAISLFGIATGMTLPFLYIPMTIIGSLSYALIPDLSSASAQNDTKYIDNRVNISFIFSLFVCFFIVPIFIGAGENIGIFFYDNAMSGNLLAKGAWIIIPMCLTNISSSILNAVGLELKSFKNYIVGAFLMLLSIWVLPKFIGIDALIIAMGSCFTISAILNIRMVKKQVSNNFKLSPYFFKFILFMIPTIAITSFLTNLFTNVLPLFFNLAISCSFGGLFFIMLCLVFNVFKISTLAVYLKSNFHLKKKKNV